MNYKNLFLNTALLALLAAPAYSFASPMPAGPTEGDGSGFYAKLQYNGEFFTNIGDLKSSAAGYPNTFGAKKGATMTGGIPAPADIVAYDPEYKSTYFAGGAAVGYSMGGPRVELEVLYSQVDVDDKDYTNSDVAEWLGIANLKDDIADKGNYLDFKNEGFRNFAGMINAFYDIKSDGMPVAPYIGAGGGLTGIKFLDKVRYAFAYQAKAGVSYAVSPQFSIFAGYRYFGIFGDEFKEVEPINKGSAVTGGSPPAIPSKADVKNSFGMHGLEAGVIFNF